MNSAQVSKVKDMFGRYCNKLIKVDVFAMAINRQLVFLCCIVFAVACFISAEAFAKKGLGSLFRSGSSVIGSKGSKLYDKDVLTVKDLQACLLMENKIDKATTKLDKKRLTWELAGKQLDSEKLNITEIKSGVDQDKTRTLYTQNEVDNANKNVDQFNLAVGNYNLSVKSFQSLQGDYNLLIDSYNLLFDDFEVDCANKSYYEDDMQLAKRVVGQD